MITNLMDNWWVFLFLYFFLLFIFFSGKEVFILGWMAFEKIGSRKFKCVTRGSRLLDRSPLRRFSWLVFPLIGSNRVKTWSSTLQIDDCGLREKLYLFCSSIKLYLILVWFILSSSADLGVQFRGKGERFLVKLRVAVLRGRYRGNREM